MSYILDALRKADAQRERDPARGIHAQPMAPSSHDLDARHRFGIGLWAATAVTAAAAVWGGWLLLADRGQPAARALASAEPVARRAPDPVAPASPARATVVDTAPSPQPAPPVLVPPPQRDPYLSSVPNPRGGPPSAALRPVPPATTEPPAGGLVAQSTPAGPPTPGLTRNRAAGPPVPPAPAPQIAPAGPQIAPAAPQVSPAAPAPAAPLAMGLPPDAPKLSIGGGVYSANPAQRMLIVNGQVFNEGSEVGGGVVLESVLARGAVLRFRGERYSVTY